MQWAARLPSREDLAAYADELAATNCASVFGHTGYLINIASPPCANRDKSILSLIQEIRLAAQLKLPFLVLHPGAHLGAGATAGLARAVEALDQVFAATSDLAVRVALENTAGQGSCLGHTLEELFEIIDGVKKPQRLAICLDTAHLFAAGYDIRKPKGWNAVIDAVKSAVGLKRIVAFHLNDSKTELGSKVDRHAHIGEGKIGLERFNIIVNDPRFSQHPGCLETPKSADLSEDKQNLAILRSLVNHSAGRRAQFGNGGPALLGNSPH
jgi:deoxyribonuclease-4